MCAFVTEVRLPEVVNRLSAEIGQDADGIEGLRAAPGMDIVVSRIRRRGRMQPPEFLLHPYAALIELRDRSLSDLLLDLLDGLFEPRMAFANEVGQRAFAHRAAEKSRQAVRRCARKAGTDSS